MEKAEQFDQGLTEKQRRIIRLSWRSYKELLGLEAVSPVLNCGRGIVLSRTKCYQKYQEEKAIIAGAVDSSKTDLQIDNLIKSFRKRRCAE